MSALSRLPVVLDTQLQRDAGINFFEYLVMAALSEAPERTMRLSDIAARAEGSLPRLSQAIGRLEKRGWIHADPTRVMAGTPSALSPRTAMTRSSPPHRVTSKLSANLF